MNAAKVHFEVEWENKHGVWRRLPGSAADAPRRFKSASLASAEAAASCHAGMRFRVLKVTETVEFNGVGTS